jgi:alkylation response protein AidB-like acyl-CoA dehydrogenase
VTGFRAELRAWLTATFTAAVAERVKGDDDRAFEGRRAWNASLFDAGFAAPAWPAAFGGRDAGVEEQLAHVEEMARAGAPGPVNAIGVANIAPAILAYGTDEQQHRFLRPMLRGDEIWSQGMSEPEAGSDLASLRCAGVRDGDGFVVRGQKTWNSLGHRADWCQLFVRTNPGAPKHKGITCLLVDMRSRGIEARPITTMAGDHSFSELFFTDVRVPLSSVLGEVDDGWNVATRTLTNERAGVAGLYLGVRAKLVRLLAAAPELDAVRRDAVVRRYIEVRTLELLAKRTLGAALVGRAPGPEGSVIKLAWSLTDQALADTAVDVLGVNALRDGWWATNLLSSRSLTIAGGTSEVNRNIVGERALGLPRGPG